MKIKLIFYLVLAATAGCWIVFFSSGRLANWLDERQQRQHEPAVVKMPPEGIWAKKLKAPWTDTKVVLYRASGEVVQLAARKAVYTTWSIKDPAHKGKAFDVTVIAFLDPATGHAWVGEVDTGEAETNYDFGNVTYTNIFFENGSEILRGGNVLVDGAFTCAESAIKTTRPGGGLDAVIEQFDRNTNGSWPFSGVHWLSNVRNDFRKGFFAPVHHLGNECTPIQHFEATNGKLRLDFKSKKYGTTGSAWLDVKTLRVVKTAEYK